MFLSFRIRTLLEFYGDSMQDGYQNIELTKSKMKRFLQNQANS